MRNSNAKYFVAVLLAILFPAHVWAVFPTTSVLDNFNRTNEGPPPSASWVNGCADVAPGWKVVSNTAQEANPGSGNLAFWNSAFASDEALESYITMTVAPTVHTNGMTLFFSNRTTDCGTTGWREMGAAFTRITGTNNDIIKIYKAIDTGFTYVGADISLGADFADGDIIGVLVDPGTTTVRAYLNGTEVGNRTDADFTGVSYLAIYTDHTPTLTMDNFGGGTYVPPASGANHNLLPLGVGSSLDKKYRGWEWKEAA